MAFISGKGNTGSGNRSRRTTTRRPQRPVVQRTAARRPVQNRQVRETRSTGGTHKHNFNTGITNFEAHPSLHPDSDVERASIGQHSHRIRENSIPPHSHPISGNSQGHYSSKMMVDDVWEGGPPMTVDDAIEYTAGNHNYETYDPSLSHSPTGGHSHFMNQQSPRRGATGGNGPTPRGGKGCRRLRRFKSHGGSK